MDMRQQRGLAIAQSLKLTRKNSTWKVPSQAGKGLYLVHLDADMPRCTCPDYEMRGMKCKHIFAVEFTIQQRQNRDGSTTIIKTVTLTDTIKKPTYPQQWPAYNAAQTQEKDKFQVLLHDLCQGLEELPPSKGHPRLSLSDAVFSACFKVYSTMSARRFISDLRDAQAKGYLHTVPHFNSILNYLDNPHMCPLKLLPLHDHDLRHRCWSLHAQGAGVSSRVAGLRRMVDGASWGLSRYA